jgi:glycosyltransferase involved in cell wall biosynthesis
VTALTAAFARLPGNLRGMALMSLAAMIFAIEVLAIRWMTDRGIPVATQVLARSAGQFVWLTPALAASGIGIFATKRHTMHLFRGLSSLTCWGMYFLCFAYLDPATGTVLTCTVATAGEERSAIEAFRRAFPGDAAARLVLKLSSAEQFPEARARLRAHCGADARISLVERHLPLHDLEALYADADALLSLHRAEGFGLTLAEAMAGALPVVATGYSGNLDFMPPGSAILIPARLEPIARSEGDYRQGCLWAEPDLAVAAAELRRLALDGEHHRRLALAGRRAVQELLAPARLAAVVAQRLGCLLRQAGRAELLAALPAGHPLGRLEAA